MAMQTQLVVSGTMKNTVLFRVRSQKEKESAGRQEGGVGFGSSNSKSRKRASAIIRRSPIEKPALVSQEKEKEKEKAQQFKGESAFLLAWLGFGGVILVEGISLAASGFLPDEWDMLFLNYIYPSFTPTVLFFIAGTVAYGLFKYLQNSE